MKRDVRIRSKVMVFSMTAVFLVAAVLVGMIQMSKSKLSGQVGDELEVIAREEIGGIAHDVWLMCMTAHETMKDQLQLALDAAGRIEREQGGVSFSGAVQSWQAKNQFNDAVTTVSLPGALVGNAPLGQNSDPATPTPLVDRIQAMTGTTATIFQRMNAQGDMLRVATNVKAKDGRRAIGTYIPAVGTDGAPNAVVQKVLGGETFVGRAFVVDDWYLTAYRPLKGPGGSVDGMLFVGVRQSSLTALREAIMNRGVGKDGYVYVLGGKGAQQGLYILSSGGKRDGENIWEAKDADGNLFIQELIKKGLATENGAFDYHRYNWSNKQGEKPKPKVAAITYFAPWDWVIGAGAYESDFLAPQHRVDKQLAAVGMWGAVLGLILLALCGVGTYLITRGIDRGLKGVSRQFTDLASGVKSGTLDVRADAGRVGVDFREVVGAANEIIEAFIPPMRTTADAVDRISRGDIPAKLDSGAQGEFKVVEDNLNRCIDAVNALVTDANTLAAGAIEGRLATRADASRHQGDFRRVIEGVNATLDAVIGPLSVAAGYIDRIAKGDTPPKIVEEYKGDFAPVRDNLNTCIDTLNALTEEVGAIVRAGKEGQLASRANADRLAGVWRKILRGCNEALDAVITPLNVAAFNMDRIAKGDIPPKITEEYKGDFNTIKNNLNTCIDAINALIADANKLAEAAVAGQLDTRADASRHEGDYRKIIDGINRTLDAVVTPIQEAAKVLERLAEYDLRSRMHGEYHGDHAKIKASLNQTAQALHDALAQVAEAVDQVSSASQQIAGSSQQVAEGSSEQASSLEETSSSLEEMASMTKQNADNTQQAKALTDATRGAADRGTVSMKQMVEAMGKIRTASEGTAQIIRDINEIAFQTNLLALNAAVEAARAGDAGRGFAVVAEEVRNLAQRAKEAAKKTEDLINESVTLSEGGEKISREVGENLEGILASVNKVSEIMNEVATASQEQSRGIEQVNAAVAEMDKVVQAAAASAEESSSASEELAGQAQELAAMVGRFQLQGQEKRPAAAAGGGTRRSAPAKPQKSGRPSPPAGRAPASGEPSGWQLKPEDIIPLEDELTLSKF